ncbi:MAG: DegT/DnrJ/EryC1/StrS family aminotransferase [Actinomycetota bacterium]|nr:DegT/DnrJ/EryC1/StrS family aminotransferase [Actinomycetota bacterium]
MGQIDEAVGRVLKSGWYIMGREVQAFEEAFASFLGASHCTSTGSGTDALVLILRALGIGPGDAVVTVSHTAVATVAAIDLVGACPVLVDVDPVSFTMSTEHLAATLGAWSGAPIRAIIPVHLYGQPAELGPIMELAARYGAWVIEDCAQAHGATYRGRPVGTIGIAGVFSFYPTKNLGAFGDGGAVITSDSGLAQQCALVKQYGWRTRYVSEIPGMNTRLDEVQAAILRVKLEHLPGGNARRQAIASAYQNVSIGGVAHPGRLLDREHVFHQYVVQAEERDRLRSHLSAQKVGTAVLYPVPVHKQPGYAGRVKVGPGGLPATESICKRILSLPIYPEMTADDISQVISALSSFSV